MFRNMFRRFEPMLDADDGLSVANGADSPTADDGDGAPANEPTSNEPSGEPETEPKDEPTNEPHEDITQTKAFSEALNRAREKDHKRIADLEAIAEESNTFKSQYDRLQSALGQFGYEGSPEEIADLIEAQERQVSPEQVRAEREAEEARFQQALENHPIIQQTKRLMEQQERGRTENLFKSELADIQKLNPEIKSLQDLKNIEHVEVFDSLVKGGMHINEAYKVVSKLGTTAPQKPNTKEHLVGVGGGDTTPDGLVEVPSGEMERLKNVFPDDTPQKLKERYNRILKRQKED